MESTRFACMFYHRNKCCVLTEPGSIVRPWKKEYFLVQAAEWLDLRILEQLRNTTCSNDHGLFHIKLPLYYSNEIYSQLSHKWTP